MPHPIRFSRASNARALIAGLIVGGMALAVVVLVLVAILTRAPKPPPPTPPPVNVQALVVRPVSEVVDAIDLPGVIEPNRVVRVGAEISGRVEEIAVEEGQAVNAGDLLMRINAEMIQAAYDRAAAEVKNDEREFKRLDELFRGGATTERERDDVATRLAISRARLAEATAILERTSIVAPITGTLNLLPVEKGEYVQPGTRVAEIVDMRTVKVAVDIPEKSAGFFRMGDKATAIVEFRGERLEIEGTITYISAVADTQTRSTRAEVTVANGARNLISGQIARMRLTRRVLRDVIMVPLLAVIPLEEGAAVYVVENAAEGQEGAIAARRTVTLGLIKGRSVEIREGLLPGDRLIVAGHRFVGPGQAVTLTSQE